MKGRLPLILVAVVAAVCVVGAVVAGVAAGTGFSPAAYSVNGKQVSQSTVNDELEWLAHSPTVKANIKQQGGTLSTSNGSITAEVSANWLTQRIQVALMRQEAARRKVVVSNAARLKLRKQLASQIKGAPNSLRDVFVDYNAYIKALGFTTQSDLDTFVTKAFKASNVTVDPRYGTWHPRQGVCPPSGCAAASTTSGG
jgi:SurA N-terminal domain